MLYKKSSAIWSSLPPVLHHGYTCAKSAHSQLLKFAVGATWGWWRLVKTVVCTTTLKHAATVVFAFSITCMHEVKLPHVSFLLTAATFCRSLLWAVSLALTGIWDVGWNSNYQQFISKSFTSTVPFANAITRMSTMSHHHQSQTTIFLYLKSTLTRTAIKMYL